MMDMKIRDMREKYGMSQSELANRLGVTRSAVNAWESGISTPTARYVAALAKLFRVSADYLLGTEADLRVSLEGYSDEEVKLVLDLIQYFDRNK